MFLTRHQQYLWVTTLHKIQAHNHHLHLYHPLNQQLLSKETQIANLTPTQTDVKNAYNDFISISIQINVLKLTIYVALLIKLMVIVLVVSMDSI